MKIKDEVKLSGTRVARTAGFAVRGFSQPHAQAADPDSGVCSVKMKEQTGTVYENKGTRQIVKDQGSVDRRFCGPRLFSGPCASRRPQQQGSALQK